MRRRYLRQLDSSAKYKASLRRKGVPLRDDFARYAFNALIKELAGIRESGDAERYQRRIEGAAKVLPEPFDRNEGQRVLREMVSRYIAERDAKGGEVVEEPEAA